MTQIQREARALYMVLDHAAHIGIPLPHIFRYDPSFEHLVLNVSTAADVRDWARWMQVDPQREQMGRQTHWSAEGLALDARVQVQAFTVDATNAELTVPSEPVGDGEHLVGGAA